MGAVNHVTDRNDSLATVQANALAKGFNVPPGIVDDLTNKNREWGDIAIHLAMAQRLMQIEPEAYPTIAHGLAMIQKLRNQNMIWGQVADELGVQVGSLVRNISSGMRRARWELRATRKLPERPPSISCLSPG